MACDDLLQQVQIDTTTGRIAREAGDWGRGYGAWRKYMFLIRTAPCLARGEDNRGGGHSSCLAPLEFVSFPRTRTALDRGRISQIVEYSAHSICWAGFQDPILSGMLIGGFPVVCDGVQADASRGNNGLEHGQTPAKAGGGAATSFVGEQLQSLSDVVQI